jgi:hypothetical protein
MANIRNNGELLITPLMALVNKFYYRMKRGRTSGYALPGQSLVTRKLQWIGYWKGEHCCQGGKKLPTAFLCAYFSVSNTKSCPHNLRGIVPDKMSQILMQQPWLNFSFVNQKYLIFLPRF